MAKKLHFVSGLPRACSTLLCNVLAQNSRVHATATSPLHEIGFIARGVFETEEKKAVGGPVMESMFDNFCRAGAENAFNELTDRPVVVDKCRSWIGHLDQTFRLWPNAKILVPVRDIRGVICSLEKKRREHPGAFNGFEKANPANWTTIEKRVQGWLSSPPVGIAIERLHEAATRFKDRLHFVHAEDLCSNPEETMAKVWAYLGEDFKGHDFSNVVQYTIESDVGWPYGDHSIRQKISPLPKDWHDILGRDLSNALHQKFDWINQL